MYVVARVLEPEAADVRGLLVLFYDGLARALELGEGRGHVGLRRYFPRESNRVLHRELRARAYGEVRSVQSVAEQHDVRAAPALVLHEKKVYPARAVRQKLLALQVLLEDAPEVGARLC